MNGPLFTFPDDEGKTPLVEVEISMNESDWHDLIQIGSFRSVGNKIAYIIFMVLCTTFSLYISFIAILSKNPLAFLVYFVSAAVFLVLLLYMKPYSKYAAKLFPNNYKQKKYSFYLHHFTWADEYSAASVDYDLTANAYENSCGFAMIMKDGGLFYIPKRDLSEEQKNMLHSVMVNKFGSKFSVTAI